MFVALAVVAILAIGGGKPLTNWPAAPPAPSAQSSGSQEPRQRPTSVPARQPSSPATQPAPSVLPAYEAQIREAKQAMDAALAEVTRAREAAAITFRASDTGKSLYQAVADADAKRGDAKATGTPQEKLDAATTLLNAKRAFAEAQAKAIATDPSVVESDARAASAKAAMDRVKTEAVRATAAAELAAEQEKERKDPNYKNIKEALKENRLTVGMTKDQAKAVLAHWGGGALSGLEEHERLEDGKAVKYEIWKPFQGGLREGVPVWIEFRDGIVVQFKMTSL
jgi:hypothetical protein